MVRQKVKKAVKLFKHQYSFRSYNYESLCKITVEHGFTIIEFNNIVNNENIEILVKSLNISDLISQSKGFTYADSNYRLVFIHEDLSPNEKNIVLAHEMGHIYLEHLSSLPIIGKDVREEYEANEFVHYLLTPSFFRRTVRWITSHKRFLIITAIHLCLLTVGLVANYLYSKNTDTIQYYITETGTKYHTKDCMHIKNKKNVTVMTNEQLESNDYKPCGTCLPSKN